MTYPWAAGEVLTASDLNNYAGLVFIKSQTIGSGVSSVTVTGAFSSTFDNYRIVISAVDMSTLGDIRMTLGSASANYYWVRRYYGVGGTNGFYTGNPSSSWQIGYSDTNDNFSASMDICNPFRAGKTSYHGMFHGYGFIGYFGGSQFDNTSFTSFTMSPASGTIARGNIRVYGYNNG